MSISELLTPREIRLLDSAKEKCGTVVCHGFTEMRGVLFAWVSFPLKDENGNTIPGGMTTGLEKEKICPQCEQSIFYCNCNNNYN